MYKRGRIIYLQATKKVHPNRGGNDGSFKKLGTIFSNFEKFTGHNVKVNQELSNENRPR